MTPPVPSFEDYLASLTRLTPHVDTTVETEESAIIRAAAESLKGLDEISIASLSAWARSRPTQVPVLGLSVGLSQEKLKNSLKDRLGTTAWITLARERSEELVRVLDEDFDLVRMISKQRSRAFDFGDVLVARAGTRVTATRAGASGRGVEDEIEAIARELGLEYATRTRFTGRRHQTAPCDLAIPAADIPAIIVAAKGFDSTGSKLTDAVREIQEMAEVRLPEQFIMVVVDGIGWKSRVSDLRKIYSLRERRAIDGMYTLASLSDFRRDLERAARLRGLL
jgi:hypothetical protein